MYLPLTPQTAVCSAWHPCWPRPGRELLRIRYSRTFPISHPSTRLCLELLSLACQERRFASLLDVGCGSGILALAGAILGVPFIVGCDLSAAAVRVSQENAHRHHLAAQVCWLQGSTEALRSGFHLIVANLPFQVPTSQIRRVVAIKPATGRHHCVRFPGYPGKGNRRLLSSPGVAAAVPVNQRSLGVGSARGQELYLGGVVFCCLGWFLTGASWTSDGPL